LKLQELDCDYVIVGQGLAGTVLGWQLRARGRHVIFFDREEPVTASKIAAGLINPIAGRRICLTWRWEEFHASARQFYGEVEAELGRSLLRSIPLVRLFGNADDLERWERISVQPAVRSCLSSPQPTPLADPDLVRLGAGGFEIEKSYVLDVAAFLASSKDLFDVRSDGLNLAGQVRLERNCVAVDGAKATVTAHRLVFCQGPDARYGNPFFDWVPFRCAKGEILTIRCEAMAAEKRILNGPGWLAPIPNTPGFFRAGSTYGHQDLTNTPTPEGRRAIEEKLRQLLRVDFEVVDHKAAVRPVIQHSRALAGLHPSHSRLGFFNGLGSKGALNAPALAARFVSHLEDGAPLDNDLDLQKNL